MARSGLISDKGLVDHPLEIGSYEKVRIPGIVDDLETYDWFSYPEYISKSATDLCQKKLILSNFQSPDDYSKFVLNHSDYARALEKIKHQIIEL